MDLRRHVSDAGLDTNLHDQLSAFGDRRHMKFGVDEFYVAGYVEVGGGNLPCLFGTQGEGDGLVVVESYDQVLEIEDDLHDVLFDPFDGRELMEHIFDVDAGYSTARDRRQQDSTQRIPKRLPETPHQRFQDEFSIALTGLGLEFWNVLHACS